MYAIQTKALVKQYKNGVMSLDGMNLSVKTGEIFSLLGQNGAGKSTLIHILTTRFAPTSGKITVLENDIYKDASAVRSNIACVAQQTSIDTYLSLEENMIVQSKLYKISKAEAKKRMEALIVTFGLQQYRNYPVYTYSGGVKRRLDIALALMSNPKILFLDEPTVGMDIQSRRMMWDMMKKIQDDFKTTIFLTTHYLEEADSLSDTICIMKDGKEVIQGTPFELRDYISQDTLQIHFSDSEGAEKYTSAISGFLPFKRITTNNDTIIIHTDNSQTDLKNTARFLLEQHIPFCGIRIARPTLEDVFLRLTGTQEQEVYG